MLRNGEPIQLAPLKTIQTGIELDDVRELFGLISEYEERDTAVQSGYTWKEWLELDTYERAAQVAFLRLHRLLRLHTDDAVTKDAEQRRKQQEARSRQARAEA